MYKSKFTTLLVFTRNKNNDFPIIPTCTSLNIGYNKNLPLDDQPADDSGSSDLPMVNLQHLGGGVFKIAKLVYH